ncbi:MAG: peptidoglycan DD-metalloendopeptidase family protein [Betaproteobacteria bacterium]
MGLPAKDPATLKAEREAVRIRAERTRQGLAAFESQRQDAVDAIADADRALSDTRKRQVDAERARDEARRAQSAKALRADQSRLARLVAGRNLDQPAEPLKLWPSGRDPSEVARMSTWLAAIGRARLDAIGRWRVDRERHAALASDAEAARRTHDESVQDAAHEAASVDATRREHAAALARVSTDLRRQRVSFAGADRATGPRGSAARGASRRSAVGQVPSPPSARGFGALRALDLPVHGELAGRFGAPRDGSGAPWRGWFIASAAGADVRAVAAGQVVWADWRRGFGNLLILDHGDGYMTLYGHNEALFASVGATIAPGAAIAQAGTSGGAEMPGVYFEIRYDRRAVDPAPWFAREAARQRGTR